ncbi:MAG TPA: ABC transporter ATP-binding protein [Acidimicrobiia bacterium]|nr:ABC transporter ATP-binding protein [Acidimicrobiia bacterium]
MTAPSLAAVDLLVGYRATRRATVVADVGTIEVRPGELVCLLGPNGVGKSTLLRTLAALQRPLRGAVLVDGRDASALGARGVARHVAAVLTERASTGRLTARQVVELGRYPYTNWYGALRSCDHAVVDAALDAVDATPVADSVATELSDGWRQRVMIARALAQEPDVLLLDEPAAFLDLGARLAVVELLRVLTAQRRIAVVLATHDVELAVRSADTLWLVGRDGVLHAARPQDAVDHGILERAFGATNWRFDAATGRVTFASSDTRWYR